MSPAQSDLEERDLIALLHARGQRVTPQRLVILRELRRRACSHVSAEDVHRAVRRELPGTSIPTVYATLDLLVGLGLAQKLDFGLGWALYDARTDPHQHAVCRRCGTVADLEGQPDVKSLLREAERQGFRPEATRTAVFGVCGSCAMRQNT